MVCGMVCAVVCAVACTVRIVDASSYIRMFPLLLPLFLLLPLMLPQVLAENARLEEAKAVFMAVREACPDNPQVQVLYIIRIYLQGIVCVAMHMCTLVK